MRAWRMIVSRLLPLLLAAVVLIGVAFPALAAEEVTSTGTLWSYLSEQSPDWLGTVIGGLFASACPTSEDNKHHGKVIRPDRERGKYIALCDHCSHEFPVYDDDLDAAYGERVTNIQNNYGTTAVGLNGYYITFPGPSSPKYFHDEYYELVSYSSGPPIELSFLSRGSSYGVGVVVYFESAEQGQFSFEAPVTGYYTVSPVYTFQNAKLGSRSDRDGYWTGSNATRAAYTKGTTISVPRRLEFLPISIGTFSSVLYLIRYFVEPYEYNVNNFTQNIGGIDSRVGKFSGNFGYYGDNGQLITADNVQIVNEGDKTYYNPATGSTSTVTDWTYDYSDRSYDLTLDTGDKINVTYGDENVTIKEGDTIYNIYYMVSPPVPEPTPTPSATPEPTPSSSPVPTPSGNPQPPPTDDPGSGEGGGSLWEKLWDAIAAFFKFIGDLIGRLLLTLLSFFTGILENVVGLVDLFGSFGEIVSSLYTWLPAELQTLIAGALAISLALAVISLFRK